MANSNRNDTALVLTPRPGVLVQKSPRKRRDLYEIDSTYIRTIKTKSGACEVWVPPNFLYDGASIPRGGWDLVYTPFHPRVMASAAVHDWLYQVQHMYIGGKHTKISRKHADGLLWYLMVEDGVPKRKRKLVYRVVRALGKRAWKTHSSWDKKHIRALYKKHGAEPRFAFPEWAKS